MCWPSQWRCGWAQSSDIACICQPWLRVFLGFRAPHFRSCVLLCRHRFWCSARAHTPKEGGSARRVKEKKTARKQSLLLVCLCLRVLADVDIFSNSKMNCTLAHTPHRSQGTGEKGEPEVEKMFDAARVFFLVLLLLLLRRLAFSHESARRPEEYYIHPAKCITHKFLQSASNIRAKIK